MKNFKSIATITALLIALGTSALGAKVHFNNGKIQIDATETPIKGCNQSLFADLNDTCDEVVEDFYAPLDIIDPDTIINPNL